MPAGQREIPFELYNYQIDFLRWLEDRRQAGEDGLVEKSRDMGASWCVLARQVWRWLFEEGYQALDGSRKEQFVDNSENPLDTIFGKLAFIVERLPEWMRPVYKRAHMVLSNKENGNAILGESANTAFARQGRYSEILLDEFSVWNWAPQVATSTADATNHRIIIGTPNGKHNEFARIRFSGRLKVYTLHWSKHPKKDAAWYAAECKRRTSEDMAQEVDINYDKSVKGRVYPDWDHVPRGDFPFVRAWPLYVSWDFGLDDDTSLIWWQRHPISGLWRAVDCYSNSGPIITFYVPFITGMLPSGLPYQYSEAELTQIERHRGWGAAIHFGDPSGKNRNQVTGTSVLDELRNAGIHVQHNSKLNTIEERIRHTKLFLRRIEGINLPACQPLDDAINQARYPDRAENSQATTENAKPIHDWTSHYRTSLEFLAVNEPQFGASPDDRRVVKPHEHRYSDGRSVVKPYGR